MDDAGQISDHRLVTARLVVHNPKPPVAVKWRRLRDVDLTSFEASLRRSELFTNPADGTDEFADQLVRVVTDELDKVAPVRSGSRRPPKTITKWLSAKRERRRMERRWQRTRNEEDRLEYRRACKTTNKLITKSRQDYYQNRLLECDKLTAAKRWQTVNLLLPSLRRPSSRRPTSTKFCVGSHPGYLSWFQVSLKSVGKCGSCGGVEISAFPLTRHIAYTTACCYRTSREVQKSSYTEVAL